MTTLMVMMVRGLDSDGDDDDGDGDDIYIMMQCLFVCHEKSSLPS